MCCHGSGYGKLFFGAFVLVLGVNWLGHDMGWWSFSLPWIPLLVILAGIAIILRAGRREGD
jgi:hypothetical protein